MVVFSINDIKFVWLIKKLKAKISVICSPNHNVLYVNVFRKLFFIHLFIMFIWMLPCDLFFVYVNIFKNTYLDLDISLGEKWYFYLDTNLFLGYTIY